MLAVAVGSLLWSVGGFSALAVVVHEHAHHTETHDHCEDLRAALHGHGHEATPDHDHRLASPPPASRAAAGGSSDALVLQAQALADPLQGDSPLEPRSTRRIREPLPPPYLLYGVLLI